MMRPLVLTAALLTTGPADAQTCFVVDPFWIAGHTTATGTLNAAVTTMGTAIATQRSLTLGCRHRTGTKPR